MDDSRTNQFTDKSIHGPISLRNDNLKKVTIKFSNVIYVCRVFGVAVNWMTTSWLGNSAVANTAKYLKLSTREATKSVSLRF